MYSRLNSEAEDEPSLNDNPAQIKRNCVHEWHYQHATDEESIYCVKCGAEPQYCFLIVDPDGIVKRFPDPGNEEARAAAIRKVIGGLTNQTVVMDDPFFVYAVVHEDGLRRGLKMQRNRLLKGLAGSVVLRPGSTLGDDDQSQFNDGRGFSRLELSVVEDILSDSGLVTEAQAERTRRSA